MPQFYSTNNNDGKYVFPTGWEEPDYNNQHLAEHGKTLTCTVQLLLDGILHACLFCVATVQHDDCTFYISIYVRWNKEDMTL